MSKKGQHVVPNLEGGWSVRKSGAERASKSFDNQRDAISHARNIAKNQNAELYVHKRDGTIRSRDSYGNDPCPPRDKKK